MLLVVRVSTLLISYLCVDMSMVSNDVALSIKSGDVEGKPQQKLERGRCYDECRT